MSGVEIRVRSNSTQARQDLARLEKSVGSIEKTANRVTNAFKNIVVTAGTIYSVTALGKSLGRASDSIANLENKLALVTGRGRELDSTMRRLSQISATTRVSMSTTAETFNRFGLALQGTKTSAEDLLKVTRTINQAVTISGASSESARAAIVQFGQGLASGQLRGQELNSVLEQTPRIARAIADGMGIPFGKLREAAMEGKLTTDAILNAVLDAAPEIEKEFALIGKTIDSVSQAMNYQFKRALSAIAEETGFSDAVINRIEKMTDSFKFFADNLSGYLALASADVSIFVAKVQNFFRPLTGLFEGIFSIEFKPTEAVKKIENQFQRLKTATENFFTGVFEKDSGGNFKFNLSGLFENVGLPAEFIDSFTNAIQLFETFKTNIKELFKTLFGSEKTPQSNGNNSIIKASLISVSDDNQAEGLFDKLLNKLISWSNITLDLFESLKTKTSALLEEFGGFKGVVDGIVSALDQFKSSVKETISFVDSELGISGKVRSLSDIIFGENVEEQAAKLKSASKAVKNAILGIPIGTEKDGRVGGAINKIASGTLTAADFAKENPILSATAAGAVALGVVFTPQTLETLKLAGIGLGLAAVNIMGELFSKGFPIALVVGSLTFLPETTKEAQQKLYDVVFGATDALIRLIAGEDLDAGDLDAGAGFVNKLATAFSTIGDAITDAIFGEKSDFTNKFLDGLTGALFAVGVLATLGVGSFGGAIKFLASALLLGVFTYTNEDQEKAAKKMGATLKKVIGGAFRILLFGDLIKDGTKGLLTEFTNFSDDVNEILGSMGQGALVGGTIGSVFPVLGPITPLITSIVGALVYGLTSAPVLNAAFEIGKTILDGFMNYFTPEDKTPASVKAMANRNDIDKEISNIQQKLKGIDYIIAKIDPVTEGDLLVEKMRERASLESELITKQAELKDANQEIINQNIKVAESAIKAAGGLDNLAKDLATASNYLDITDRLEQRPTPGFANGGFIRGAGGPRDDKIPAMLSNGEYVINAASTAKHGNLIRAINEDRLPKFANGGDVTATAPLGWDIYNDLDDTTVYNKAAFKKRLSLFDFSDNYIDNASSALAALVDLTKQLTDAGKFYKPSNIYDYLFSFAKKNSLGPSGNEDRSLKTDNLSFGTTLSDSPYMEQGFKRLSINTNTPSYKDFDALYEQADSLYRLSDKSGLDVFKGYDDDWKWDVGWEILGWKAYDATNFSDAYYNFVNKDSHYGLLDGYSRLKERLLDSIGKSYSDLGFESFDSAVMAMSGGYNSKQLKDHAFSVINGLRETYRNFYGKDLQVEEDAEAAGVNAWFWQGDKDNPAQLGLMSFSKQDPGKFLIAYYAALHEVGHAYDYLKDTKDTFFNDKWPSRFTTPINEQNYRRLINETDANIFARRTLLPNMDKDFVDAAVHFSQGSYLSSNLESALKQNANLFKEYPQILGVLKDSYNFDLRKLATEDIKREYVKDAILAQWFRGNEIDIENDKAIDKGTTAAYVWENIIEPNLGGDYYHEEKFDLIKRLKRSLSKVKKFATGGYVTGEGGPTDDKIPAMLSNGEFVIRSSMAKKFGPILEAINSGTFGRFAGGKTSTISAPGSSSGKVTVLTTDVDEVKRLNKEFEFNSLMITRLVTRHRTLLEVMEDSDKRDQKLIPILEEITKYKNRNVGITDSLTVLEEKLAEARKNTAKETSKVIDKAALTKEEKKNIRTRIENFQNEFASGLSEALKTGDFEKFGKGIVDKITGSIIDSFVEGFTTTLLEPLTKEGGPLQKLFEGITSDGKQAGLDLGGLFGLGKDLGEESTKAIEEGAKQGAAENTPNIFKSIGNTLKGLWEGVSELFSGMFSGGGGGGFSFGSMFGGMNDIFSGFGELPIFDGLFGGPGLGFFGANNGGIVPNTPYSQIGKDSVPAMLTPGELVVPADKVKGFGEANKGSQQTFNINVSGDVSRQTRKEIVKMLPEITSGVNMVNKENNFRR
jgi:tape measure domain-containing protein